MTPHDHTKLWDLCYLFDWHKTVVCLIAASAENVIDRSVVNSECNYTVEASINRHVDTFSITNPLSMLAVRC